MIDPTLMKCLLKIDQEIMKSKLMIYMHQLGEDWITKNTGACGMHTIPTDVGREIIQISTLFQLMPTIRPSVLENCLCNIVIAWNDLLSDLFLKSLNDHLTGAIKLPENIVRKIKTSVSLGSLTNLQDDFLDSFNFLPHKERLKLIEQILNVKIDEAVKGKIIKAIEMRNVIQHHNSIVTEDLLKRLGRLDLEIFNNDGTIIKYQVNNQIQLTLAEVVSCKNAFYNASYLFFKFNYPFEPTKFTNMVWFDKNTNSS